jgi:1-aminocyclopropane-1-carboxylate deaminase/D-cysteine desulfhydrase-like pyridoxal-dependent ACC family enzyme
MQLKHTPITLLNIPDLLSRGISLSVKRDDLQHPIVSGNKLFKLFYHLEYCKKNNIKRILTFGGAYSNHLHAAAYVGYEMGIETVAIIRGEQIIPLNPTLRDCTDWGMILEPVSRLDYKQKEGSMVVQDVIGKYPGAHIIPEGGCDLLGVQGASKILDGVDQSQFDYIICACGTGATIAGIVSKAQPHIDVIGMAVLKGASWMRGEVQGWLDKLNDAKDSVSLASWRVNTDYHFGGYGKIKPALVDFIERVGLEYDLPLEPIYTGKSIYGVFDLVDQDYFPEGSRILFIHTGGLQGIR